jgi:hypothetical protein
MSGLLYLAELSRHSWPPRDRTAQYLRIRQAPSTSWVVASRLWALTLFPRGSDQVIPQVLAVLLFYLSLVVPVGTTREGLLCGR